MHRSSAADVAQPHRGSTAAKAPDMPVSSVKLISPISAPIQGHASTSAAMGSTSKEMCRSAPTIKRESFERRPPNIEKAGIFLKANSSIVGLSSEGYSDPLPRLHQRS